MPNDTSQKRTFRFKRDRYLKARGGSSCFLDIFCSVCGNHIALYQKDGPGALLRMYLDRIFAPATLNTLQNKDGGKKNIPNLHCLACHTLIGTPMVYELESRLAFRMVRGSFAKKNSDGTYPPPKS